MCHFSPVRGRIKSDRIPQQSTAVDNAPEISHMQSLDSFGSTETCVVPTLETARASVIDSGGFLALP